MLTKAELLEKIDLSLYSEFIQHHGNDRDVDDDFCRELATVALDTILENLPDVITMLSDSTSTQSREIE